MSIVVTSPTRPERHLIGRWLFTAAFAAPTPLWLCAFFVAPLAMLVAISFWRVRNFRLTPDLTLDAWQRVLGADFFWDGHARTLMLSGGCAVLLTLLALPASYAIAFVLAPRARLTVLGLMVVPFFTSYPVRTYSWQVFLAENGLVSALASLAGFGPMSLLNTPLALVIGYATLALPVVIILQTISLASVDRVLLEAAYNLRAGPLRALFAVVLPAAKPGIVLGALFAFILSFGDFVTPLYLGGGAYPTLPILITDTVRSGQQWPRAAVISLVMIATLLTTAVLALAYAYRRKG